MEQFGKIVKVSDNKSEVSIVRKSACGGSCSSCKGGCETSNMIVQVENNNYNVNEGDIVKVFTPTNKVLKMISIAYIIPLIIMIITMISGVVIFKNLGMVNYEILGFLIGIIGLVFSFFVVRKAGSGISKGSKDLKVIGVEYRKTKR